jgi:hypothetical protein
VEAGHDIEDGSKKVDFLVMTLPLSNPEDFTAKSHALVNAASGDRVIVKTPKHRQLQYNTLALYGKDSAKHIADNHKQLSTRMKQLIVDGDEDKHVNTFVIFLPWQVTNKYNKSAGTELCTSWASEETYNADEKLVTVWKYMDAAKLTVMPIMSLEFRVAIPETIKDLEVYVEQQAIDNFDSCSFPPTERPNCC